MSGTSVSRSVFLVAAGLFGAALIYGVLTHKAELTSTAGALKYIVFPITGMLVMIGLGRLPAAARINAALAVLSTAIALYLAETMVRVIHALEAHDERVLAYCDEGRDRMQVGLNLVNRNMCLAALAAGRPFDRRSRLEVIHDLEAAGRPAVPALNPVSLLDRAIEGPDARGALLPLGGLSDTTTVYCNETGEYVIYESDEHGFRNPKGLYVPGLDVGLVGDSFTKGLCLREEDTISGQLRQVLPNVLNLGADGNGPLLALATVREYLAPLKAAEVLWLFYEGNDLENLEREKNHPLLRRYLGDAEFEQALLYRQAEVDRLWREFLSDHRKRAEAELAADGSSREEREESWRSHPLLRFLLLNEVRKTLRVSFGSEADVDGAFDSTTFRAIVRAAEREVSAWGGELTFVYLPTWARFAGEPHAGFHDQVLEIVESEGVRTVDLVVDFEARDQPLDLFPFRQFGHYAPEGSELVAERLLREIESGGASRAGVRGTAAN